MKSRRTGSKTTIDHDIEQGRENRRASPRLKKDHKTDARARELRKEGKASVQPTASRKDEKIDPTPAMFKSNDKADAKSISAKKFPLNQLDQKLLKMWFRTEYQIKKQLIRELAFLESVERQERKRLDEVQW